jgi:histidine decarboxylase
MTTVDLTGTAVTATDPMAADRPAVPPAGEANVDSGDSGGRVAAVLAALRHHLDTDRATNIGFPSTFDFDYSPLWPFFNNVLNNVGDPYTESAYPANTKHLEREVIEFFARLLRAPADDYWGYVTTGGTEGSEYGLLLARTLLPDAMTYVSQAAHYSGPKLLAKLGMPAITVRAGRDGRLDLRDLRRVVEAHRHRPAVVLATIGTTMTEAVDDVAAIRRVLDSRAIRHCYVHADAALSGLPLALLDPGSRPAFDLSDGADSISVSAHKALGCPFPAGIVMTRRSLRNRVGAAVDYIGTHDTTIGGSRSGHAPLVLWYAINLHGVDGLRRRFHAARQVAEFAVTQLGAIGWSAWRNPHALTVVMDTPPDPIRAKWRLASSNGQSHLIAVPGITAQQVRGLVQDLADQLGRPAPAPERLSVPVPRSPYPVDGQAVAEGPR